MFAQETVKTLAQKVQERGGRLLLVGGCVRDEILQLPVKDYDCEVYNLSQQTLYNLIKEFGEVNAVGASFQVYKLGQDIDVSLPRRERKTGVGHKGFTVEGDGSMSFKEACSRRDFTVNAVMKDPLTGEIIDPFNGLYDIRRKVLKVVSPSSFKEDSLRVLRLAQFVSRFRFIVDPETRKLAQEVALNDLPKERIWMELEKLFLKSPEISLGVEELFKLGISKKLFPSLVDYEGVEKNLYRASILTEGMPEGERLAVMLTVLCWKSAFTVFEEIGVTSVNGYNVRSKVELMWTAIPHKAKFLSDYDYHMCSQVVPMRLFGIVMKAMGFVKADAFIKTVERLGIGDAPVERLLQGKHLIELGLTPSKEFGEILDRVYDAQLRGEVKTLEEAKQLVYP